jgi:hypothetical protein
VESNLLLQPERPIRIFFPEPKQQTDVALNPPFVKPFGTISSSFGNYKPQLRYTTKEAR